MSVKSKLLHLASPANEESLSARVDRIAQRYLGRHVAHLTPRYVVSKSREILYNRLNPGQPWLTADAIAMLSTMLRGTDDGLEYGSGRSTLWFAQRTHSLISVEDSPQWHARVSRILQEKGVNNVRYRFVPTDLTLADDPERQAYVLADPEIAPQSLDYALVDGSYRDECVMRALEVLRPGGMLILDNANWYIPHPTVSPASASSAEGLWREFMSRVANWRMIWTSNGVSDTAIWLKK
jgi:predicted O-methyltransferase YrrM